MIGRTMKIAVLGILLLASFTGSGSLAPMAPYPHSDLIREMEWHWETYTNAAVGSDLWPITWGPDDNLYTAWGDGGGFGGSDQDGRVSMGFARIDGFPEHWRGININGGKNPEHPATFPKKGKTGALIFVHGILYASVNLQDGAWPNVNHELAWSTNYGATWKMAGWRFSKDEGSFQPSAFLNFGRDYAGAPLSLADYVYLYGVKRSAKPQMIGRTYLARVPAMNITNRASYEFFRGIGSDGKAMWTADWNESVAVFTDTNSDTICSAVYAPALKRYLLGSFHRGPGQLGVFDSANPWGPWTTVCYYEDFGRMGATGEGLICEFPQKWMSADGLTLWCVFSGYGDGAKIGINGHDRLNLIKATLELYSDR
jgi:hypothetical protein